MAKISPYQKKKVDALRQRVFVMYKAGLTCRQIAAMDDVPRSFSWVSKVCRELEAGEMLHKSTQGGKIE